MPRIVSRLLPLLAALMLLTACRVREDSLAKESTVNGPSVRDDRLAVMTQDFPWRTIGKLSFDRDGERVDCTATLISADVVATAGRCVLDDEGRMPSNIEFRLNLVTGEALAAAAVLRIWYPSALRSGKADGTGDWALMVLDRKLGDLHGHMQVEFEEPRPATSVYVAGYSRDFRQAATAWFRTCRPYARPAGTLLPCNDKTAAVGAPMFFFEGRDVYLLGVQESSDLAVSASAWSGAFRGYWRQIAAMRMPVITDSSVDLCFEMNDALASNSRRTHKICTMAVSSLRR